MSGISISLSELDVYSQIAFGELQTQRFEAGMSYYICLIREEDKTHLFDAAQFIEHCIRSNRVIRNPKTNIPIDDENIEVRVASRTDTDFRLYMQGRKALETPAHLPILWNDPSRPKEHRLGFKYLYAKSFETRDPNKAIRIYKKTAKEGSTAAKIKLGILYSDLKEKKDAIRYFHQALQAKDISAQNVLFCNQELKKLVKM